ncbi:NUDIX hydrolase [Butyrivibrio sp. MC2013]|uniref:NUDIX hydrolase n=1 Tax=Butyrivibrio sp. MC2013 TaxID=1280686 RepID=UPI0004790090|nr:8-oxo-dGTP diphosphatase [Butyrivibrio sp. MC2013]
MKQTPCSLTTLCYIDDGKRFLMMNRNKKKRDVNSGKWIGVGGHFEDGEDPVDCLLREVHEETGLKLLGYNFRGIVTFVYDDNIPEYMHLFTADSYEGEIGSCDEGDLEWIDKNDIFDLELWEGDKIFLKRLVDDTDKGMIFLKLRYDKEGNLLEAIEH